MCNVDLSRVFETVERTIHLDELETCGVCGTEFKWFKSYLSISKNEGIKLGNRVLWSTNVDTGYRVPQGNVLDHLFFNIYIVRIK